ncbi:MAG: YidC/Oxa1 family membrane protein insertase [Candidatus Sungiibacteriota bacterium]
MYLYTEFLWRPLFNGLVFFYNILPGQDLGIAIIALTITIRLILAPLLWKAQAAQKKMALIQPELKRIQAAHKGNKEAQSKALMELYAAHQVNPFSGCLVLLIQLPILIALFQVFRSGLDVASLAYVYGFLARPEVFHPIAFGFLDLTKGNIWLGVMAAATQFFQTKLSTPPPAPDGATAGDFAKALQWQTTYFFPVLILLWSYSLPAALTLYWTAMNVFGIIEQLILQKKLWILQAWTQSKKK